MMRVSAVALPVRHAVAPAPVPGSLLRVPGTVFILIVRTPAVGVLLRM